jgi:dCTP deaminase
MLLNGDEIIEYHNKGLIKIDPWDPTKVGSNSYDVCLYHKIKIYGKASIWVPLNRLICEYNIILDPHKDNATTELEIPYDGLVIPKNKLILGGTNEVTESHASDLVPMIDGRSSIGRLGLMIHLTAGRGDIGYCGRWTLEIVAAEDVIIYPLMPIAQLSWVKTQSTTRRYQGHYQRETNITESRLHQEIRPCKT